MHLTVGEQLENVEEKINNVIPWMYSKNIFECLGSISSEQLSASCPDYVGFHILNRSHITGPLLKWQK